MILLATTAPGIARAERSAAATWHVDHLLAGTRVTILAVDPNDRRRIWAGTKDQGVLRSDDAGATWRPAGLTERPVMSLVVSPHDPDVAYAGVKPVGVVVTRDGGESWTELTAFRSVRQWWWFSPADPPGIQPYVSSVGVSPSDPGVLIVGVELGGVFRSDDGGASWSRHRRRADRDCHDMCFHARDGDWIYEAGGGGPAVSSDGGRTWRRPTSGLAGSYSMAVAADPERPEVWYVSAAPHVAWPAFWRTPTAHYDGHAHTSIYRSDGGAAWEKLDGGLPPLLDHMAYALRTDTSEPGHVYAGLANGQVWHSRDYGDHWTRLPVELGAVRRTMVLAGGVLAESVLT